MPPEDRPSETALVDFVTHSEVSLRAPPAAIWPHIVDTNAWFHGQRMTHEGGPRGAVGERFVAATEDQPEIVRLRIENVELVPERRRTIRIHDAASLYLGYATWVLEPDGERTTVGYHTYCRYAFPASVSRRDALDRAQRAMDDTFQHLKRVVER